MAVILTKIIDPLSLRGIGSIPAGVAPHALISAGHNAHAIAQGLQGTALRVGRTSPRNAFCVHAAGAYYLYVHREYTAYRSFFLKFFKLKPADLDVDHVMSRSLASKVGASYLLLAVVPCAANRAHGAIEKLGLARNRRIFLHKAFPLDERMVHKVMGRRPAARQDRPALRSGYTPGQGHGLGVTLKQRGIWNLAFCVHLAPNPAILRRLKPL